jgi:tRNA threonylcarbamoyladenosine biosynthesis protein TsaE
MMGDFFFTAENEDQTAALGAALAELLPPGTTVALCGPLGAGKTRLVQALAAALGVDRREVVSPTFVMVQEYSGRREIVHIDAYRVKNVEEFYALGTDEYFAGNALMLIEWADRVTEALPAERLEIQIEAVGDSRRRFKIRSVGQRHREIIARLSATVSEKETEDRRGEDEEQGGRFGDRGG